MTRVIDTGSCGCHIAHGVCKDGAVVSGRGIELLSGLMTSHYLFTDIPPRRDECMKATFSDAFPTKML